MELKEFITAALADIVEGIEGAKSRLKDNADMICPLVTPAEKDLHGQQGYDRIRHSYLKTVDFDIAVSAESNATTGGKAGINVLGLQAHLGGDLASKNSTVSRIKFQVPIGLKVTKNPGH